MAAVKAAHVAPWKREIVDELCEQITRYPVVGIVDFSELPARQFQQIRQKLRGAGSIIVTRSTLLKLALEKAAEANPKLGELVNHIQGQTGLILSNLNTFKLNKFLKENMVNAPARPGSKSARDIVIPAGETDLPPGPVVGELQRIGLKARIQAGKVVILEDNKLVSAGDTITKEISDVLAKFGIMPLELGLRLRAAYEDNIIFFGEVLRIDEAQVVPQLQQAGTGAFNLAMNLGFPTRATIPIFLAEAAVSVRNLAINACIPIKEVMPEILSLARKKMFALAAVIREKDERALGEELKKALGAPPPPEEKPEEEKPKEEKPKEEKKEEEMAGLAQLFG
jgi:large subunit ribosomal protein L10